MRWVRPDLTSPSKATASLRELRLEELKRGDQLLLEREPPRDVDRRRDHVVRGLSEVHLVVRVHCGARILEAPCREACHHLVRIHVRRGARPRLVDVDDEFPVPDPVADFRGGRLDRRGDPGLEGMPSSPLVRAEASLMSPSAWIIRRPNLWPLTGKFSTARWVCAP